MSDYGEPIPVYYGKNRFVPGEVRDVASEKPAAIGYNYIVFKDMPLEQLAQRAEELHPELKDLWMTPLERAARALFFVDYPEHREDEFDISEIGMISYARREDYYRTAACAVFESIRDSFKAPDGIVGERLDHHHRRVIKAFEQWVNSHDA